MKKFILLALTLGIIQVQADVIQDRVHSISEGLIRFQNGRVARIETIDESIGTDDLLRVTVDSSSKLISLTKISQGRDKFKNKSMILDETTPPAYEPTIVPSMEEMQKIFNRSDAYYKRVSECTDRAHVWAYDEFKRSGTKSEKIFVFFTASYINSVGFKWWFHVAPLYSVKTPNGIQKMVADFRYSDRPKTVKEWTDQFVYTKRSCKVTTKFSEYDVNPQTENCYLIYTSMYYKLPGEIFDQERLNRYKTSAPDSEFEFSRRTGFQLNKEI